MAIKYITNIKNTLYFMNGFIYSDLKITGLVFCIDVDVVDVDVVDIYYIMTIHIYRFSIVVFLP
jgi:hypothetical protein